MAAFENGHIKVEGSGQKKGVKHQNTELRAMLRNFAAEHYEDFVRRMSRLEDKDFCVMYEKLLKYNLPTISSIKFEDQTQVTNAFSLIKSLIDYKDQQK